jgi:hypothetical protein
MRLASHARLLGLALLVWLAFWVGGLPDYYRQYPFPAMLAFCAALVPPIVLAAVRMIGRARPERRRRLGGWLALYFTVPLLALDYAYCGIHLGHGWGFLASYWYLTAFYVVPWLVFVPVGAVLARRPA